MVEYVLIADVNDSDEVAAELGELLKGVLSSLSARVLGFLIPVLCCVGSLHWSLILRKGREETLVYCRR